MPISASDLAFVYSGGASNNDPTQSLGGDPSAFPIVGNLNNLFPDVSTTESANGFTDFRCFYIFNDSQTDALYSARSFILSQIPDGSTVSIGFYTQNDQQAITIFGSPTSGTMTLLYETFQVVVTFDPDPTTFAANVQTALNHTANLSSVRCQGFVDNGAVTVMVYFENADGNRFHPLLTAYTDSIVGATNIQTIKVHDGGPINAVTSALVDATASPPGVVFNNYISDNPYTVGNLYPGDGFAVWVQRTTPAQADGVRGDGFTFRLMGEPTLAPPPTTPPTFAYVGTGGVGVSGEDDAEAHGPGFYQTDTDGGVNFGGSAEYVVTDSSDGKPHIYYDPTGGLTTGGVSITKTFPWFRYAGTGGITMDNSLSETVASTSGIDFVSTCQIFGCEDLFPISWQVTVFGDAIYTECNQQYVIQSSRMDFDPTTCSWRGIIGTGDPTNAGMHYYFDLSYEVVPQTWILTANTPHTPTDPGGGVGNCVTLTVLWNRVDWNCCGDNSLTNASSYAGDFHNLQVYVNPVKYCTPRPCSYYCGKCCRDFKCPKTFTFQTHFQTGTSCYNGPLHGTFTLNYLPNLLINAYQTGACGWIGDIPGANASWFMQFDPVNDIWVIYVHDPTFTYVMSWQVSDRDFSCCGITSNWTLTPGQNECLDSNSNVGVTFPADPSDCQ